MWSRQNAVPQYSACAADTYWQESADGVSTSWYTMTLPCGESLSCRMTCSDTTGPPVMAQGSIHHTLRSAKQCELAAQGRPSMPG